MKENSGIFGWCCNVSWKNMLRDVGKFILILLLLSVLLWALNWVYGYFVLEGEKIASVDDLLHNQPDDPVSGYNTVIEIARISRGAIVPLTTLATFFAVPPKPLFQITLSVVLIFLMSLLVVSYHSVASWAIGFAWMYGYAITAWGGSYATWKLSSRSSD